MAILECFLTWWNRPPKPLPRDEANDVVWLKGQWWEICRHCGGNCGQCGNASPTPVRSLYG